MPKNQINILEKQELKRSVCPVSCVLDLLGDKWTLLVVRDMFMGKKTYGELQKSPEKIPTNILAERLKRLEQFGIAERSQYQQRPVRYAYTLTEKGRTLGPIIRAMMIWGNQHVAGTYPAHKFLGQFSAKQAKQAPKNVQQYRQGVLRRARTAVVVHDGDSTIVTCNSAAQELLGLSEKQMIGKTAMDPAWHFTREDGSTMPIEEYPANKVLATKRSLQNYIVGVNKPNKTETNWVLVNADAILNSENQISEIIVTFMDITERKRSEDLLRDLSQRDSLTGVFNRRSFDEIFEREWRRAVRNDSPISLTMIDIDYFKKYNDMYGHPAGDDCLIRISKALLESLRRPTDFLARYGGEEFGLILQDTDSVGATHIAEEMRMRIEDLIIPHSQSTISKYVTICAGVSGVTPTEDKKSSELLSAADRALYQAKQSGRNQIVTLDIDH